MSYKKFKRADSLEIGDIVLLHDVHTATVVAAWPNSAKPNFTLLALKNEDTGQVAEMSILNALKVEVLEIN